MGEGKHIKGFCLNKQLHSRFYFFSCKQILNRCLYSLFCYFFQLFPQQKMFPVIQISTKMLTDEMSKLLFLFNFTAECSRISLPYQLYPILLGNRNTSFVQAVNHSQCEAAHSCKYCILKTHKTCPFSKATGQEVLAETRKQTILIHLKETCDLFIDSFTNKKGCQKFAGCFTFQLCPEFYFGSANL